MSSNKRQSMMPPPPKPPTKLSSTLIISDSAQLIGTNLIIIGSNTVIHPRARLNSSHAPITIGNSCILSERCQIGFSSPLENEEAEGGGKEEREGVRIENGVVIEVGAVIEARRVGEGSFIEVNARVGREAVLGKHCKIGPLCEVAEGEILPDYTVIYGNGLRKIDRSGVEDMKIKMVERQVEVLRKLIPSNLAKFQ